MIHKLNQTTDILSPAKNYRRSGKQGCASNSIIDFDVKEQQRKATARTLVLSAIDEIEEEKKRDAERTQHTPDCSTRIQNEDGSYTDKLKYKNGSEKLTTYYNDGSYDEIYNSKGGLSYTRIKRFENPENYTEIYQDSSGFCGKETFVKLSDGTSVSTNEFNNGKKYVETYKKNSDGGFTRRMENSDGTGYVETQAYNPDGSSSYSIKNADGSGNTIVYNPDGSYVEILVDANGKETITKFGA